MKFTSSCAIHSAVQTETLDLLGQSVVTNYAPDCVLSNKNVATTSLLRPVPPFCLSRLSHGILVAYLGALVASAAS